MFRKPTSRDLQLPLTPMIDCTFQLILFFLLAAQLAGQELPKLALHTPEEPTPTALSVDAERRNHVTVNVLTQYDAKAERDPAVSGMAKWYQVGVDVLDAGRPDAIAKLSELIASRKPREGEQGAADFWVEIRSDKDIRYGDVEPVMQAASDAGIVKMSLTAAVPKDELSDPAKGE